MAKPHGLAISLFGVIAKLARGAGPVNALSFSCLTGCSPSTSVPGATRLNVHLEELGICALVHNTVSERQSCVRRIFLAGREAGAVEFQKQNSGHKTRLFVAVDERMVPDDARRVEGGKLYDAGGARISEVLLRPSERRFQQAFITHQFVTRYPKASAISSPP
jgi:hypothetical protein